MVPVLAVTGRPPDRCRHHPTTVQRQAGQQVEGPTASRLSIRAEASRRPTVPGSSSSANPEGDRRQQQRDQRPGHGDPCLAAGVRPAGSISETAEQAQVIGAPAARAERDDGVAELVHEDRHAAAARRSATRRTARRPAGTSRSTVAATR